jgi:hypothetical protein
MATGYGEIQADAITEIRTNAPKGQRDRIEHVLWIKARVAGWTVEAPSEKDVLRG